ncbi:Imm6 family immunity protein [Clostridium sp.]|uniref:Imm6 family immunity protein n=1 Tax=Clostridium sp. TaxID=1506 RepID=UPI0026236168|nr:Imm6 family immunity protein [Clostridium sp.]
MQSKFFSWLILKSSIKVFSDKVAAQNVVNFCWEWLQDKKFNREYLYNLLDDGDCGITLIQEMSKNEKDKVALNCIIDAIAYTNRKAYETEGAKYFLDLIELVDTVCYTSWNAYKKESRKYIRQALEGIKEESLMTFIESAIKTGFIS